VSKPKSIFLLPEGSLRGLFDEQALRQIQAMTLNDGQMIEVLKARSDLQAILDVAQSDPDYADSPLLELSNVTLTPHIAGSMGRECYRLGEYAVEECRRYLNGQPPVTALDAAMAEKMT